MANRSLPLTQLVLCQHFTLPCLAVSCSFAPSFPSCVSCLLLCFSLLSSFLRHGARVQIQQWSQVMGGATGPTNLPLVSRKQTNNQTGKLTNEQTNKRRRNRCEATMHMQVTDRSVAFIGLHLRTMNEGDILHSISSLSCVARCLPLCFHLLYIPFLVFFFFFFFVVPVVFVCVQWYAHYDKSA